jgi:hypothetical protein
MLGKMIGAVVGDRIARRTGKVSETKGALLGVGTTMVLRRLGPMGLVAAVLGGYAVKRYMARRDGVSPAPQ